MLATERGATEAEEAGNEDFPRILLVWKENPPKNVLEYVGEGQGMTLASRSVLVSSWKIKILICILDSSDGFRGAQALRVPGIL